MKQNIFGMFLPEIAESIAPLGIEAYRARQICQWMYQKGVLDFADMTNLPVALRESLGREFAIEQAALIERLDSSDGRTVKFLLGYADGVAIETVLMRQPYGNSVCVSTQAGCNMGCRFCASTINGMTRNLTRGEILAQVLYIGRLLQSEGKKVDTIVVMGSGEPLANYDSVLQFIRLCHEPYALHMGYRNITVSTSGIVPMIERLSEEGLPVTLSISLHAPNDAVRNELMPINRTYGVRELARAGKAYGDRTGRRVTYEYILIAGVNDSVRQAEELSALLKGQMANVNLIPVNPVAGRGLRRPDSKQIERFKEALEKRRLTATVRKEMGNDIQAACGQLRNKHLSRDNPAARLHIGLKMEAER